jgi:hypothetical protein
MIALVLQPPIRSPSSMGRIAFIDVWPSWSSSIEMRDLVRAGLERADHHDASVGSVFVTVVPSDSHRPVLLVSSKVGTGMFTPVSVRMRVTRSRARP